MAKIQVKRGDKASLPQLSPGEFGLTTDTQELFIGGGSGNIQIPAGDTGILNGLTVYDYSLSEAFPVILASYCDQSTNYYIKYTDPFGKSKNVDFPKYAAMDSTSLFTAYNYCTKMILVHPTQNTIFIPCTTSSGSDYTGRLFHTKTVQSVGKVDSSYYEWEFQVTGPAIIVGTGVLCLTGDTLITMADKSEKRLDEICTGDEILSFDWETMQLVPNKIIYTDKDEEKSYVRYDKWIFDDGTEIKTVHGYEFYNAEAGRMKYMDEWKLGEHAYRKDGKFVALTGHEVVEEAVRHYKISGEKGTNYFANGLLNGDRNNPKNIKF